MTTLRTSIGPNLEAVRTTGSAGATVPFHARLDDEIVLVSSLATSIGRARLLRGQFGTTRADHAAGTTIVPLPWAALARSLGEGRFELVGTGAPTDGANGTGALVAARGSTYTDLASGALYVNSGPAASPSWTASGGSPGGPVAASAVTFDNGVAGLPGDPVDVQGAIEAAAEAGGGLPAWWDVDSEPSGAEYVSFEGSIEVTGAPDRPYIAVLSNPDGYGQSIRTDGGASYSLDAATSFDVHHFGPAGGHFYVDDTGIVLLGAVGLFGATPVVQQTLARPSGDAGALWDILAAYGLVVAP